MDRARSAVGTSVLFENDRVRIWELRLEPGQTSGVHQHELDHILVLVSGDRVAVQPEPDTAGPFKDYLEADVVPGTAVFVPRGGIESAINTGDQPYYEIIVELKDGDGWGRGPRPVEEAGDGAPAGPKDKDAPSSS